MNVKQHRSHDDEQVRGRTTEEQQLIDTMDAAATVQQLREKFSVAGPQTVFQSEDDTVTPKRVSQSVSLILFTLLLVHPILRISPHHTLAYPGFQHVGAEGGVVRGCPLPTGGGCAPPQKSFSIFG